MDWRKFCKFDSNISIAQSPLPIFWIKSSKRFTDCGELTVLSPLLLVSISAYFYLFITISKQLRCGPSLSSTQLTHLEILAICLKFFSSFGALTCTIVDLIFAVAFFLPTSSSSAALVTISGQIFVLLLASVCWLSILCGSESIRCNTFAASFPGWISISAVMALRFYDEFLVDHNWGPRTISILTGLCIHFIYIITVVIIDFCWTRLSTRTRRLRNEDEMRLVNFEEEGRIYLGSGDDQASWISKFTFSWTSSLMKKGYRRQLTSTDELYYLPASLNVHDLEKRYSRESNWKSPVNRSFIRTMHSCFGWEFYSLGILKFFADSLAFAGPILLGYLVDFMTAPNAYWWLGYVYAAAMIGASLLSATFGVHFNYEMSKIGLKVRSVVITLVYGKITHVPQFTLKEFSSGELMNLMSTDSERVVNFVRSFHDFWSLPMQIAVALFLLYRELNLAFLAGLAFALFLIPVNRWIAKRICKLSTGMMERKDSRVKLMAEVLFGIRVVKFSSWEETFSRRISAIREQELKFLKDRKYLDALCVYLWASAPVIIATLAFTTYVLMGYHLTASKVFTSIALFNILVFPLNAFPWVINGVVEAWVSCKRLQRFLDLKEFISSAYYTELCSTDPDTAICMHDATFSWSPFMADSIQSTHVPALRDLTFSFRKGQLIGVIGPVGSGKSSLFSAILAEMAKHDAGSVYVKDVELAGVAYFSQEPWLQHGTVRQNILFGKPYQADVYEAVVLACALISDFRQMPYGDLSEVGEQGVTLSGGQRARIALARAVYQRKEIYLLDDPLSAVDAQVAKTLFTNCIRGLLHGKTVILATHQVDYLREADVVVVIKGGSIEASGPPSEILDQVEQLLPAEQASLQKAGVTSAVETELAEQLQGNGDPVLVLDEEREVGIVKARVYGIYLKAIGGLITCLIFSSLFFMQGSKNVSDWWLSYWVSYTDHTDNNTAALSSHFVALDSYRHPLQLYVASENTRHRSRSNSSDFNDVNFYLKIYGILIGSNTIFALLRAFLYAYGCVCAAKTLHEGLLSKILKAPVRFFDTTPVGRLVNRFSSDVYSVDDSLPFQANRLVASIFGIAGTTVTMCYGLPWFSICILPMGLIYYFVQRYYRYTTCDLKRLTSTSLSPMYSHFTDTVNGLQTIRAFRATDRFAEQNRALLTANQRAQYSTLVSTQWLAVRLQLMGVAVVGAVAMIAVLEHHFRTVDPGLVGLAISYALSVTGILNGLLQSFTETEKEMVAVERISDYVENVPTERWIGVCQAPQNWPSSGKIEFINVHLRYASHLPLALNNVSFTIRAGERIGIVGRTGAGKSSILQALFRAVELESGSVLIDDVDTVTLDLSKLRSSLAVIPQAPFLFSGSVRENLDIEGQYNDIRLQWVIESCQLVTVVDRLGGLQGDIGEKGAGLSVGEKQLFCLARALLANARVLCIDEATAHVDTATDELMQNTLKSTLLGATVITIAHRIRTIMDYDRILVMREGQIIEDGPPRDLLATPGSHFASLAKVSA